MLNQPLPNNHFSRCGKSIRNKAVNKNLNYYYCGVKRGLTYPYWGELRAYANKSESFINWLGINDLSNLQETGDNDVHSDDAAAAAVISSAKNT